MDGAHDHAPPTALCVLASGSSGNGSVLRVEGGLVLLDAGLSPRRTAGLLAALGHGLDDVRAIVLTHLDSDHFRATWAGRLPEGAAVWAHAAHAGDGRLSRLRGAGRLRVFDAAPCEPAPGVVMTSRLARHDDSGVATLRLATEAGDLGFLTDLGEVSGATAAFHQGVGVLAIESNYCPRLQARSARPDSLKRRIMGGAGHLSNLQCLRATEAIAPAWHTVFLHLSRECNRPELVAELHEGAHYARTIAGPDAPTRWVPLARPRVGVSAGPIAARFGSHA